jgi:aminoglycoside 6'-N-acetyltransferase
MTIELQPLDVAHAAPLRRIHQQPGVMRWWGPMESGFPFDEPESTRSAIVLEGEVAGMVQWGEEVWPHYRYAWIDIFVGDDLTGRGIGTEAVRRTARMLIEERGHHRITIDPATDNVAAIRCYEKAGFTPVGTLTGAYHDPRAGEWRDELLMELVSPGP